MGLFGKLFDKKECSICGGEIGLLGNRKLEDGNLCKECASKLSPWFDERRHSTIEQIEGQLAYRKRNEQEVERFHVTRSFGEDDWVYLDDGQRKFIVSRTKDFKKDNPDVLDLSQVTGCDLDIKEHRHEEKQKNAEGKEVSYNPPRYRYTYDFYLDIRVNHSYFDDMRIKLNNRTVEVFPPAVRGGILNLSTQSPGKRTYEYQRYETMGLEIRDALLGQINNNYGQNQTQDISAYEPSPAQSYEQAEPVSSNCPWCGSEIAPGSKFCGSCGGKIE